MTGVIEAIKSALPFEAVLRDVGIHLERGKAPCPFHEDRNPSFSVKGERGRCWAGCFSGDTIDFTAKFYGLDTKGAIRLLAERAGIKPGTLTPSERRAAAQARAEREKRQALVAVFRRWEQTTVNEISEVLQAYRRLRATHEGPFTESELQELARFQSQVDYLEYVYEEILCSKDDREKFSLYREDDRWM